MEFDPLELFNLRKFLYNEVHKLSTDPEFKDFEAIKTSVCQHIACKLWEKMDKPHHQDLDIWLEAENVWNFLRYGWVKELAS